MSLGIIVCLGAVASYLKAVRVDLDKDTLCPKGATNTAHTAILVDKTDFLTELQGLRLREMILATRDRLAIGDRLSLILLDENSDRGEISPIFSLCKPADGIRASVIYQNPRLIRRRFARSFGIPLDQAISELLVASQAPRSPLVEALSYIAAWPVFASDIHRTIIFVSDFLQHTPPKFSHYTARTDSSLPDFDSLWDVDLRGVSIELIELKRDAYAATQEKALADWRRLLGRSGAKVSPNQSAY